jgi:hypothetical protein
MSQQETYMPTTKKFKVMVNGQNFLIEYDGKAVRMGFYTTLFLEATDPESADFAAANLLRADPKLRDILLNERDDPPRLVTEGIEEIQSFDGCQLPRTGFVFYDESTDDADQYDEASGKIKEDS